MNEFWALVLGAVLATVGGIIGNVISYHIQKQKEKKDEKKKAYIKMLTVCHRCKLFSLDNKELCDMLSENTANAQLYASLTVKKEFDKINNELIELYKENISKEERTKRMDTINALISVLAAQMKKELGLSDDASKQLLALTIEKKEDE